MYHSYNKNRLLEYVLSKMLMPRQNGYHFVGDIVKFFFLLLMAAFDSNFDEIYSQGAKAITLRYWGLNEIV